MIAQVDVSITALAPIKHRFADFADLPAASRRRISWWRRACGPMGRRADKVPNV
jgi:hypothetical protein